MKFVIITDTLTQVDMLFHCCIVLVLCPLFLPVICLPLLFLFDVFPLLFSHFTSLICFLCLYKSLLDHCISYVWMWLFVVSWCFQFFKFYILSRYFFRLDSHKAIGESLSELCCFDKSPNGVIGFRSVPSY